MDSSTTTETSVRNPALTSRARPQAGDVIVARDTSTGVRYTTRQVPGSPQFGAASEEDAVRFARDFARKHGVDVWYSEGGTLTLVAAFRRGSRSGAASTPLTD